MSACQLCGDDGWYVGHEDDCYETGDCQCSGIQIECECGAYSRQLTEDWNAARHGDAPEPQDPGPEWPVPEALAAPPSPEQEQR